MAHRFSLSLRLGWHGLRAHDTKPVKGAAFELRGPLVTFARKTVKP